MREGLVRTSVFASKKRDMPQIITIGAFVLGAVLILVALVGGGSKVFGAEVSGEAGSVPRILAVVGAFFLILPFGQYLVALNYNNRGMDYYERKAYDEAISEFSAAIRVDPNYALAYINRGRTYLEQGNYAQAQADFDKTKRLGYTPR